jgi:hypothetical protein
MARVAVAAILNGLRELGREDFGGVTSKQLQRCDFASLELLFSGLLNTVGAPTLGQFATDRRKDRRLELKQCMPDADRKRREDMFGRVFTELTFNQLKGVGYRRPSSHRNKRLPGSSTFSHLKREHLP